MKCCNLCLQSAIFWTLVLVQNTVRLHLSHKTLCSVSGVYLSSLLFFPVTFIKLYFWTPEPLWGSLTPLSSSISEPLFLLSLLSGSSCSLIKTRLGSQLLEPAGEQRRRCSSSWNSAPHSSSSSFSSRSSCSSKLNGPPLCCLLLPTLIFLIF